VAWQGGIELKHDGLLRASVWVAAILAAAAARPADASVIVNISQAGSDVVATFSGSINLTALTSRGQFMLIGGIDPALAIFASGNGVQGSVDGYSGFTGPASWGSGGGTVLTSNTGSLFDVSGPDVAGGFLLVPHLYVSGSALSGSTTFANQTLSSIGVITGTYTYTWGSGQSADSVVVNIGAPESGSLLLLTLGSAGLLFVRFRGRSPHRTC